MQTEYTLTVRELSTGWNDLTIGRICRRTPKSRTYLLQDLTGRILGRGTLDTVCHIGRIYAQNEGYPHGAAICAA